MSGAIKPGDTIAGRYRIETLIAEGGMASIYRGRTESGQLVAIKVLYDYYAENQVIRARFLEEGRIQQMLGHHVNLGGPDGRPGHPNVVSVYEIVDHPLAIIMEHIAGPTLDDYLARKGPLDEQEVLDLIIPVMSAVGLAHSKGIIHRDIKPSNILLHEVPGGFVPKVMDFGVAKVKDAKQDLTATGTTVGTLHYMSPEQIVGSKNIDGRADVYSLGVTMYKLVTGEVPFNAPTEFALMMAQVEAPPLPPSQLRSDISPGLERVILRAMEKKPDDRFQSIKQFTTALLNMSAPRSDRTVRDTLTESISQEILEFALSAEGVARDLTGEMNLRRISVDRLESAAGFGAMPAPMSPLAAAAAADPSGEATVEMASREQIIRDALALSAGGGTSPTARVGPAIADATVEQETGDETQELTSSQILDLNARDEDVTREGTYYPDEAAPVAETQIMNKVERNSGESGNITRPSRPVGLLPESAPEPTDEVETNSVSQRVRMASGQVIVLDKDVSSRELTAPKVPQKDYAQLLSQASQPLERPSGPKVVLGYQPADTHEKTFEKPNYRTQVPDFITSRGADREDLDVSPVDSSMLMMEQPAPPPVPRSRVDRSLIERVDDLARAAISGTAEERASPLLLAVGAVAVVMIVASLVLFAAWIIF